MPQSLHSMGVLLSGLGRFGAPLDPVPGRQLLGAWLGSQHSLGSTHDAWELPRDLSGDPSSLDICLQVQLLPGSWPPCEPGLLQGPAPAF